jgi:hypothetical protein
MGTAVTALHYPLPQPDPARGDQPALAELLAHLVDG